MYKDIEKRRANWRKWYLRHKKEFIKRNKKYNQSEAGKKSAIVRARRQMDKSPDKWKARQELRNVIYRGKIEKKPCEVCGDKKVQGHHEDYTKPLEVKWLCSKHHKKLHENK